MSGEPIKLSTYPLNDGGWLLRCDVIPDAAVDLP